MEQLFLRVLKVFLPAVLVAVSTTMIFGQTEKSTPKPKATPTPAPITKGAQKPTTADQIVETALFFYAFPGGRTTLNQIRKTTLERGRSNITAAGGRIDQVSYQKYVIRGDSLYKERIRLDLDFPSARYSLVYDQSKIFGIYNNSVFTPREDALKSFENQLFHGIEVLLSYKENESTLELVSREKVLGVDYHVIDVTDKQGRKTRFYISAKSYRVMMLTYEDAGVKYKRKYYDYNYAQGTLVPSRSVLWAGDTIVEETEVLTVTYGQKVNEEMFKAS